jgi:hypothetical protein
MKMNKNPKYLEPMVYVLKLLLRNMCYFATGHNDNYTDMDKFKKVIKDPESDKRVEFRCRFCEAKNEIVWRAEK